MEAKMEEKCCGEKYENNCCDNEECCKNECESTGCEMTDKLMMLADHAWNQALIEKMKKELEKTHGAHMNEIAKVAVEGFAGYWKMKMEGKQKCEEFKEKVRETMSGE